MENGVLVSNVELDDKFVGMAFLLFIIESVTTYSNESSAGKTSDRVLVGDNGRVDVFVGHVT